MSSKCPKTFTINKNIYEMVNHFGALVTNLGELTKHFGRVRKQLGELGIGRVDNNPFQIDLQSYLRRFSLTNVLYESSFYSVNSVLSYPSSGNYCFNETCNNRGLCVNHDDGFSCDCDPGFTGENCTDAICVDGLTCHNFGLCS